MTETSEAERLLRGLAVALTCDECAADQFPGKIPGRLSELPGGGFEYPGDPHACTVHASCATEFVACGFTIQADSDDSGAITFICPHIVAMLDGATAAAPDAG